MKRRTNVEKYYKYAFIERLTRETPPERVYHNSIQQSVDFFLYHCENRFCMNIVKKKTQSHRARGTE